MVLSRWAPTVALVGARLVGAGLVGASWLACGAGDPGAERALPERVGFNRDIRPILSDRCYACHGPDPAPREAELRFDRRESAVADRDGRPAIAPGDPAGSELVRRIRASDPAERMPPPESGRSLAPREVALLERWIEQGAPYQPHWSYTPLRRPGPPPVADEGWVSNPIDRFVLAELERRAIPPSPEADPVTRVRRLHFDLVGLPPEPEVVEAFAADPSPAAWGRLVDRLLASPHFGERMAVHWLDLVRYADTNGYHVDEHRHVYAYRDYVIRAFNENRPYDRFTIEQLAGDLLPDATLEQRVASGYNRLNRVTTENGAQAAEYLAKYAADRVRTTASVWLGTTLGCAECHDHKFDPLTARDFYAFAAFFADLDERGYYTTASSNLPPEVRVPRPADAAGLARIDAELAELRRRRAQRAGEVGETLGEEETRWRASLTPPDYVTLTPLRATASDGTPLEILPDGSVRAPGPGAASERFQVAVRPGIAGVRRFRIDALPDPSLPGGGPGRGADGAFTLSELVATEHPVEGGEPRELRWREVSASGDGSALRPEWAVEWARDGRRTGTEAGWAPAGEGGRAHHAVFESETPIRGAESLLHFDLYQAAGAGRTLGRFRISAALPSDPSGTRRGLRGFERSEWRAVGPGGRFEDGSFVLRTGLGRQTDGVRRVLAPSADSFELALGLGRFRLNSTLDTIVWTVRQRGAEENLRVKLLMHDNALLLEAQVVDADVRPAQRVLRAEARRVERLPVPDAIDSLRIALRWTGFQNAWRVFYGLDGEPPLTELEGGPIVLLWPQVNRLTTSLIVTRPHGVGAAFANVAEFSLQPYRPRFGDLPPDVARILELPAGERTEQQEAAISELFLHLSPRFADLNREIDALEVERARLEERIPLSVVSRSVEPRTVRVLPRGDWMDESGEVVQPDVPAALPPLPTERPADRLALARWIASAENPLTARTAVNRLVQLSFGRGLATTVDDLGSQGAWPTHPELLDWLAAELVESGWDLKHLIRLLVTSSAYRQSSQPRDDLRRADPENRWLARQNRFRLDAEFVRDGALAVSGLLSPAIGGPSVKPYQPPDYWRDVLVSLIETPATVWEASSGEEQYRRGLYTYWKRSFPHPALVAFDAPSREECVARRARTNTPLQALVLLNDPSFVEAARSLAERAMREAGPDPDERLTWAHRRALSRAPEAAARERLREVYETARARFDGDRKAARRLTAVGAQRAPADLDPVEVAAWTEVARVLLNLAGTIYRY